MTGQRIVQACSKRWHCLQLLVLGISLLVRPARSEDILTSTSKQPGQGQDLPNGARIPYIRETSGEKLPALQPKTEIQPLDTVAQSPPPPPFEPKDILIPGKALPSAPLPPLEGKDHLPPGKAAEPAPALKPKERQPLEPVAPSAPSPLLAPQEAIRHGPVVSQFPGLFDQNPRHVRTGIPIDDNQNPSGIVVGVGGWGVRSTGSPLVPGQWQSTSSSPFWDIDGLRTDGTYTFNFWATGTDNDSTKAGLQFYGPNSKGFLDFTRFPHAQEHLRFDNMNDSAVIPGTGPGSGQPVIAQDLHAGDNYVMRVDQFEAQYKYNVWGQPNLDKIWVRAGINIWDQREFGSRQANDTVHCFMNQVASQQRSCHVLSQRQGIDWNTFEITPMLEARWGRVNLFYSHTLRAFSVNDQTVLGNYTDGGANILNGQFPYSVVPETLFNMDKVKLGIDVNERNRIYAYGYYSYIENATAAVSRTMGGVDVRWTNTSIKGLNLTTYFKNYNQSGERPLTLMTPDQIQGLTPAQQAAELAQIRNPIGFNRYTLGEKFNWLPGGGTGDSILSRLSFTGGYEFDYLIRSHENWYFPSLNNTPPLFQPAPTIGVLYQPNTTTNSLYVGVQVPWTEGLHTYARYKVKFIKDALVGYTALNGAVNSDLPDLQNIVEFGADWLPSSYFGVSANQTIDISSRLGGPQPVYGNSTILATTPGDVLNFAENAYCTSVVLWYRPTEKLTLSANSDYFSNQIKQNVIIGDDLSTSSSGAGASFVSFAPNTSPWSYGGTALEFGGGLTYQLNQKLRLNADYEITFGKDLVTSGNFQFASGAPIINTYIPLGSYSAVQNVMQQLKIGLTWKPRERMSMYLAYQLINFEDRADSNNSGNMSMILGGVNCRW